MSAHRVASSATRLLLAAALLIFPATDLCAQEPAADDVVKVSTDLVVLDAQVIDKKTRRTVANLSKEDFHLIDNGVSQQITYFSRDELPLSIILLLDVSRSVRSIIHEVRDGAMHALARLKPDDQVAVMAFANTAKLAQDFTGDRALVSKKIEEVTSSDSLGNATFLGPALESAAIHMQSAPAANSRRVIIVITDNIAVTSGRQERDVLDQLFETGTVVYGLIVRGAVGKAFNVMFMGQIKAVNKFVEQTGGEIIGADKKEVDEKLAVVIDHLRARYAIGFRPTRAGEDDKFRPVQLNIIRSQKEKLTVITKRGYYLRSRKPD